jgi:hypothetical protein
LECLDGGSDVDEVVLTPVVEEVPLWMYSVGGGLGVVELLPEVVSFLSGVL